MHAGYMVQMIDTALTMMGPGTEILQEILKELGEKHARFGVTKEMYPAMGKAIVHAVQTVTEQEFDKDVTESWLEFYAAISEEMVVAGKSIALRKSSMGSIK